MAYYHDIITEKSWQKLQELKKSYDFVLIGGWAVYLYTKALKSRDIDFICDYEELQKIKIEFELIKNERLKKYEIHIGEFDVDIYVPFYSDFAIPVSDLQGMTRKVEGLRVLMPEALLILKQGAYLDRAGNAKGEKDRIDIISLLKNSVDISTYRELLKKYKLIQYGENLKKLIIETRDIPELELGEHAFAKMKKRILGKMDDL